MSDTATVPVHEATPSADRALSGRDLWIDRLRRFAASGLTITAFCKAEGVRTQAFYHWRNKLARQDTPADRPTASPAAQRFVPVRLRPDHAPVEIVLPNGVVLRLSAGCDLAFVRALPAVRQTSRAVNPSGAKFVVRSTRPPSVIRTTTRAPALALATPAPSPALPTTCRDSLVSPSPRETVWCLSRSGRAAQTGRFTTTLAYDAQGNVLSVLDARGNTTSFAYDKQNRIVSTTDALGRTTTVLYDAVGNVWATVDAANARTTFGYDAVHRQVSTTDALNQTSTLAYDAVGNLLASTDANNHTTSFGYDELNRVVTVVDALNQTTSFGYDAVGNTVTTTDALDRTTTLVYDALNRVVATVDALGGRATLVYDAVGNVVAVTDENNHTTSFGYDALNRQVTTTDALGQTSTLAYDAVGNVVRTVDALGRTTTLAYDGRNLLGSVIDALGGITTLAYDQAGNQVATTDANGHTSTVVYDALDRVLATVDAGGFRSTLAYDTVGNLIAVTDANNHTTSFGYDVLHRRVSTTDALGETTTLVYDKVGNLVAVVEADGARTTLAYDAADRQVSTTDALNKTTTTAYDAVGNVVASTDANNHTTSFGYDALDRVVTVTDALGRTTTLAYDAVGNQVATTNARGYTTTVVYDELDRTGVVVDALGGRTTLAYDSVGNLVAITDANSHTTSFGYDALDRQVSTTDALAHTSTVVYDGVGNTVATVDPLGYRTTLTYNARDELVSVLDAGGGVTTLAYDDAGNRIATTDPNGNTTTQVYDSLHRVVRVVDAEGYTTTYQYDVIGRLTLQTDASGNTTTFAFDERNLLVRETDALGNAITMAYDDAGQLASRTDRLGRRIDWAYDDAGRMRTEKWYATGGAFQQTQTFAYDAVGNLTSVVDPSGTLSYAYDALDRLVREDGLFGSVFTHVYDAVGNRTVRQDSWGGVETFSYDAADRLTSQRSTRNGSEAARIDYAYTDRDQVESVSRYTDLTATTLRGSSSFSYDAVGRETHFVHKDGSGTTLSEGTYAYDVGGRLTEQVLDGTTTSFAYDQTDQLTSAGTLAYDYDGTGNRDSTGYSTTTGNRMEAAPGWTYAYDAEGNRQSKTNTSTGEYWTYTFNTGNRLVEVKKYSSAGGTLLLTVQYTYDAFGRRVQEVRTEGGTTTTRFVHDGDNLVADLDGTNALVRRYLGNGEMDDIRASISAAGVLAWYLTDRQKSVVALTDASGAVQDQLVYDAFGNLVSESSPGYAGRRHGYTSKEFDAATQLQLNYERWYDSVVGRWLSEDPIRWRGGDVNLTRYVGNNPANATDPTGLWRSDEINAYLEFNHPLVAQFIREHKIRYADLHVSWLGTVTGSSYYYAEEATISGKPSAVIYILKEYDSKKAAEEVASLVENTAWFGYDIYTYLYKPWLTGKIGESAEAQAAYLRTLRRNVAGVGAAAGHLGTSYYAIVNPAGLATDLFYRVAEGEFDPLKNPSDLFAVVTAMKAVNHFGNMSVLDTTGKVKIYTTTQLRELHRRATEEQARLKRLEQERRRAELAAKTPTQPAQPAKPPQPAQQPTQPDLPLHRSTVNESAEEAAARLGMSLDQFYRIFGKCFAAGTPMRTPDGWKPIESLRSGDLVLSRDQFDVAGSVVPKVVEEVFVLERGRIRHLWVEGRLIRTTGEHPFFVEGKGWVSVAELCVGDKLASEGSTCVEVEEVSDTGTSETVYNLRVADFHTYFIGCQEWGFSVWAHNADCFEAFFDEATGYWRVRNARTKVVHPTLDIDGTGGRIEYKGPNAQSRAERAAESLTTQARVEEELAALKATPPVRRKPPLPSPGKYIEDTYNGIDVLGRRKPGSNMPHGAYGKLTGGTTPPHGHHIVPQVGRDDAIVGKAQEILRKVGIDPIHGQENLVWAPNWGYLNSNEYAEQVLKRLQMAEQTKEGIATVLKEIAEIVADGQKLPKLP